jgi:hypothetical protein
VLGNGEGVRRAISEPEITPCSTNTVSNGVFYWQDNESSKQGSLRTNDRKAAAKLLHVKNEAHRLPTLNLTMARAYLSAHDTKMSTRTWAVVMREMGTHGIASTQERCARTFCSKAFDSIRHKPLVQTSAEDLLTIVHNNGHSIAHYLRRLHNLACDLGWLAWPILAKPDLAQNSQQAPPRCDGARARGDYLRREESGKARLLRIPLRNRRGSVRCRGIHRREYRFGKWFACLPPQETWAGQRTRAAEHRAETQEPHCVGRRII